METMTIKASEVLNSAYGTNQQPADAFNKLSAFVKADVGYDIKADDGEVLIAVDAAEDVEYAAEEVEKSIDKWIEKTRSFFSIKYMGHEYDTWSDLVEAANNAGSDGDLEELASEIYNRAEENGNDSPTEKELEWYCSDVLADNPHRCFGKRG